jgi:hypothetical protein
LGLRSSNNPFILVNRLNALNQTNRSYDTVLWENGELAWEFPEEKNGTSNGTVANGPSDPVTPPSRSSDKKKVLMYV